MSKVLRMTSDTENLDVESMVIPVQTVPSPVQAPGKDSGEEEVDPKKLVLQAQETCDRMIAMARSEAEQIIRAAHEKAINIEQIAHEEGHAKGYETGHTQALADAQRLYEEVEAAGQRLILQAKAHREQLLSQLHIPLTTIAMQAIRTILRRELSLAAADVDAMVSELLQVVTESQRIEVRVHPNDYAQAMAAHPKWKSAKYGEWDVVIVPDSQVQEGGVEVVSDVGRVDARLETKLELLEATIASVMERSVEQSAQSID